MRSDEMRDAGSLTGTALSDLAELARDTHKAIAGRIFGLAGKPAEPIRLAHDSIAAIAYTSTRVGMKVIPAAAATIAGAMADPAAESVHDAPRGRFVLGALSGFWGDRVAEEQASLAPLMRMRLHGGPLRRVPANLAHDTDTSVTGRLVVFAHGLCETDLCWSFSAEKRWGDRSATYGSMLRDHDGWTPIYLNFNTGVHISANGRELADQLENLVAAWPVPVTEIALVGHSLGGLVARSAAHQADELGYRWVKPLRHIVGLGTPHLGAPLERFVNWGTHRLARLPETRPVAVWLNRRSVGIKDLRYGAVLEADWFDADPDELLQDRVTPALLIPGVAYSMASATLSREAEGLFAIDLLVQHSSAHGIGKVRSIPFDTARTHHIGGRKHHFDLLADATVYDALRGWLAGADGAGTSGEDTDATRRENRHRLRRKDRRPRAS
jgi:pimeloyl-ACP methyl ester carboxylesterase